MKFKIQLTDGDNLWWEEYIDNTSDITQYGKDVVTFFNNTLRPNEKPRTFVSAELISNEYRLHEWDKNIKGMSVQTKDGIVDLMYCKVCGITAKRHGLAAYIKRDPKYKSEKYEYCSGKCVK